MNYRQATLLATSAFSTAGTKSVDINVRDLISRLIIIVEGLNTDFDPDGHPADFIKSVEVVDGSEVVCSMSGVAAQAMHYYNNGSMDHNELNYEDNAVIRAAISLDFGRHLWDELFALDPTRFKNLQLKIEHDKSLAGCGNASINIRVLADMFDEKVVTPQGFMLNKEVYAFSPADGAAEYVELPVDEILRKLLIINTSDTEEPDIQFETIKLDEEDGKRILVDALTLDVIRMYDCLYPRFSEYFSGRAETTANNYYVTPCKDLQIMMCEAQDAIGMLYRAWGGGRRASILGEVQSLFHGVVSGRCPHGAVPLLFGKQDSPDDWWDTSRVSKARLILTPRAATPGGCDTTEQTHVLVQQAKRY